jgi:23S rRNA pseudouridine2605 synthase
MATERLQKIIARAGFASRREAEELIREGRVTVNGKIVTQLGTKADAGSDHVKVDGKLITRSEPLRYILFNKPREVMTTVSDPAGRTTVMDYIRGVKERIFPVGRLDYHSEGLILLTNDGELAHKVSHPSTGSVKTYHVKVRGVPEDRLIEKLERGITIDGRRTLPCQIERLRTTGRSDDAGNTWYAVKLREGRTQQIRKMFKAVGHPVAKLRRVSIGPIADEKLTSGEWRELTKQEVRLLGTQSDVKPKRAARPAARKAPSARKKATPSPKRTPSTRASASKAPAKSRRRGDAARRSR